MDFCEELREDIEKLQAKHDALNEQIERLDDSSLGEPKKKSEIMGMRTELETSVDGMLDKYKSNFFEKNKDIFSVKNAEVIKKFEHSNSNGQTISDTITAIYSDVSGEMVVEHGGKSGVLFARGFDGIWRCEDASTPFEIPLRRSELSDIGVDLQKISKTKVIDKSPRRQESKRPVDAKVTAHSVLSAKDGSGKYEVAIGTKFGDVYVFEREKGEQTDVDVAEIAKTDTGAFHVGGGISEISALCVRSKNEIIAATKCGEIFSYKKGEDGKWSKNAMDKFEHCQITAIGCDDTDILVGNTSGEVFTWEPSTTDRIKKSLDKIIAKGNA